jgi:phosphate/sulfate permease
MTLTEPSTIAFFISLALSIVALLAAFKVPLPGNSDHAVYVALVGYAVLALAVVF